MLQLLDNAIDNTRIIPDAVFTAHVHNYQRFTRTHKNKEVQYIVAGAGGYWHLHWVQDSVRSMVVPGPIPDRDDVILEKYCDDHHGFMLMRITPDNLSGEYTLHLTHKNPGIELKHLRGLMPSISRCKERNKQY
jgi:acid phosphatase type 7